MTDDVIPLPLPEPTKQDKPLLRLVRDGGLETIARPCEHGAFTLDEQWKTVECGRCGAIVDAYAALRSFAVQFEEFARRQAFARQAETGLHLAHLRQLSRLTTLTDDERSRVDAMLARHWGHSLEQVRALAAEVERAVDLRRSARRTARESG